MRRTIVMLCACCWASFSSAALATITIDVGTHYLQHDTPNQVIEIYAHSPGDLAPGMDLALQIVPDSGPAPAITAVDIIGPGTIFNASNTGQRSIIVNPRLQMWITTTDPAVAGFVAIEGLLARVTVDTTGLTSGTFEFKLKDMPFLGYTDFTIDQQGDPIIPQITNGWIVLAPEPGSGALALVGLAGLVAAALDRRRAASVCQPQLTS